MRASIISAVALFSLMTGPAFPCDDHYGFCKVREWHHNFIGSLLFLKGTTTCETGDIAVRYYDGNGKFLGVSSDWVIDHAFSTTLIKVTEVPELKVKFSIGRSFLLDGALDTPRNGCAEHQGECRLVDSRTYRSDRGWLMIESVSTCERGHVDLFVYDGRGNLLGGHDALIRHHVLETHIKDLPDVPGLTVKYTMRAR